MKLIIGLGNPGPQYAHTRHNLGFMAVEALASELGASWKIWGQGSHSEIAQATLKGEKVILQKPLTYMNLSGQAAVAAAHFFKILPDEILVIHDDLDLPFGDVRLKVGGGEGGQNGLKSITKSLSSSAYARVRMGIGRPPHAGMDPADWVLKPFGSADWTVVDNMVQRALQGIGAFASGPDAFKREMNTLNARPKEKKE